MEQHTEAPHYVASPSLASRVRSFQHDALAELFDGSFDDAFEYAHALTGDDATAERALTAAYLRVIERIGEIDGDSGALPQWVLGTVEEAIRRTPHAPAEGIRGALGRLGHHEHQAITLRLVAGLEPPVIAAATGRRVTSLLASQMAALRGLAGLSGLTIGLPAAHRQLDAALERVLQGDSPAEAATYAPAVQDALELLKVAASIVELPRLGAGSVARSRVRSQFLAAGDEHRALWVHAHHRPAAVPGRRPRPKASNLGTAATLVVACALALVAGVVLAAAAAFASPSSAVYPLKRLGEDVLLGVTTDRIAKANLEVKLSEERLKEAETEAAQGHGPAAAQAIDERHDALRLAAADLAGVPHRGTSWKTARDRFETEAGKPIDTLERALAGGGASSAAADVKASYQRFQTDRQQLDKELGVKQVQSDQTPPPAGLPGSVPTPSPPG